MESGNQVMQTTQHISVEQLHEVVLAIFGQGPVVVKQAYSDFGCPIEEFVDANTLIDDLRCQTGQTPMSLNYTIYYPEAKGHTYERKITLKPKACNGHTFRFAQEGWGLVQFQCDFRSSPRVECRIAVNSEVRANTWFDTYPNLQNPCLWDWDVVNKKAGRLVRLLRMLGKRAEE